MITDINVSGWYYNEKRSLRTATYRREGCRSLKHQRKSWNNLRSRNGHECL